MNPSLKSFLQGLALGTTPVAVPLRQNQMTLTIILFAVAVVVFAVLWYNGQLKRFAVYVQETREELKKCAWPTWDELRGSTVLVMLVTLLIGLFTFLTDIVFGFVAQKLA